MFSFLKSKFSKKALKRVCSSIGGKIKALFSKSEKDEALFAELEKLFFEADLGVATSLALVQKLKKAIKENKDSDPVQIIKTELLQTFPVTKEKEWTTLPHVILCVGVNGSGKTTTIAKLAHLYHSEGKKVLLAAADTYRAAAVEQLELWAQKLGIEIVKSQLKSDPASVVFDALSAAKARGSDLVIIDTAGRLQNKKELMQELEKIKRVCAKVIENSPHETLLILDATVGQNGIDQAKTFNAFTPIDGIILSKMDSTAKGGIVVAISEELKIPVKWLGVGEKMKDLIPFDKISFVDDLLNVGEQ